MVTIRSETDKNVIKSFNKDQKRIYDAWRNRKAEAMTPETYNQEMMSLEKMMANLCKG